MFFASVADKGLSVAVSGLESTLAGWSVSVDSLRLRLAKGQRSSRHRRAKVQRSKRVCRLCGGGNCGRSEARRRLCLGYVAEWMGRSAAGCQARRGLKVEMGRGLEKRKKKQVP